MSTNITNWIKRIGITFLLINLFHFSYCQEIEDSEINFENGLPSNSIKRIRIDKQNSLWVCTSNGLSILPNLNDRYTPLLKAIGDVSVWDIYFTDSTILVGTRTNGLFIFNNKDFTTFKRIPSELLNNIRKIMSIDSKLFILTDNGPYRYENQSIQKVSVTKKKEDDFIIDLFLWNREIFGLTVGKSPPTQIVKFENNSFEKNYKPLFVRDTTRLKKLGFFSSLYDQNTLLLGGAFIQEGLHIINKQNKRYTISSSNFKDGDYVIWDIVKFKDKIALALGDVYTNKSGGLVIIDTTTKEIISRPGLFVNCLSYDSKNDILYYGTENDGIFSISSASSTLTSNTTSQEFIWNSNNNWIQYESSVIKIGSSKINDQRISAVTISNDTLAFASKGKIVLYNRNTRQQILKLPLDHDIDFISHLEIDGNTLYSFLNYGPVFKYNLKKQSISKVPHIDSYNSLVKRLENHILVLNKGRSFGYINRQGSGVLASTNNINNARDFCFIDTNTVAFLIRNRIIFFSIDRKNNQLDQIFEVASNDIPRDYIPTSISYHNNRLYIFSNSGVLLFDMEKRKTINYFYFNPLNKGFRPFITKDSLYIISNYTKKVIPLRATQHITVPDQLDFQISKGAKENASIDINIVTPDYHFLNHALKRIEIWEKDSLVFEAGFIKKSITLNQGLSSGNYTVKLFAGNKVFQKAFIVSIPLLRNPIFYISLVGVLLLFFVSIYRFNNSKRELLRRISYNKLEQLRKNLNPHFLYNSMNLVSSLILEEKYEEAIEALSDLSLLQRQFLETSSKEIITLHQEIRFIDNYILLQQKRLNLDNAFVFVKTIDDRIHLAETEIPPLLLQPLIENAIKYGVQVGKLNTIEMNITQHENRILISIENEKGGTSQVVQGLKMGIDITLERVELFNKLFNKKIKVTFLTSSKYKEGYRVDVFI